MDITSSGSHEIIAARVRVFYNCSMRWRTVTLAALGLSAAVQLATDPAAARIVHRRGKNGIWYITNVPDRATRGSRRPERRSRANTPSSAQLSAIGRSAAVRRYRRIIADAARRYRLPESLIASVLAVESAGNPQAVSVAGAEGLMQLIPRTQAIVGVADPFDPRENILGGARYLRRLADRFDENLVLVVAGYHAGERAVEAAGRRIPDIPSTRDYVARVLRLYYRHRASDGVRRSP